MLLPFLITKTSLDQFEREPFAKMFLYFDILTLSSILFFGSLSLILLLESIYVLDCFILMFYDMYGCIY